MRTSLLPILLVLALPAPGWAQRYEDLARRYQQPDLFHEAAALPAGDRAAVVVSFRISNQMLVFVRNRQGGPGRAFVTEPRVTVQVYRRGRPVAEQVWQHPHYAATFDQTQQRGVDLEGSVRFILPAGDYTYRLALQGEQANREQVSEPRPVTAPDFRTLCVGAPILARDVRLTGTQVGLDLANLGGRAPYGEAVYAVLPIGLPDSLAAAAVVLRYVLRRLDEAGRALPGTVVAADTVAPSAWIPVWSAGEALWGDGEARWPVAIAPDAVAGYLVPVDVHGTRLHDGSYVLETTLQAGDAAVTNRFRFDTYWRDMPISLYHPDVAIRNLEFIEGRQIVKEMHKGSLEERQARIRAYWEARDPTPETPFNELMAEYYRRVDYAADAFRTGQVPVPDGLRTDQASVYILHGPPRSIDRAFPDEGGVLETWTYADGRRFVFRASTSLDPFRLESRPGR